MKNRLTAIAASVAVFATIAYSQMRNPFGGVNGGGMLPIGTILEFAGSVPPAGFVFADGAQYSCTAYQKACAVFLDLYGGDGVSTFNVPDKRGRVGVGRDNMGGTAANRMTSGGSGVDGATLGASGGSQTHTLTTAELSQHSHANTLGGTVTFPNTSHTHPAGGLLARIDASSTHLFWQISATSNWTSEIRLTATGFSAGASAASNSSNATVVTGNTSTPSANTGTVTISNANAGSGNAHQNTQPSIIVNYIVKIL